MKQRIVGEKDSFLLPFDLLDQASKYLFLKLQEREASFQLRRT